MKYAITPALTLTATVNPDFGQVEADPAVVNLERLRNVLPGAASVLRRRLGRLPLRHGLQRRQLHRPFLHAAHRAPAAARRRRPDNGFVASPANTTIIGATKVTGRDRRLLGRRPQRADRGRGSHASRSGRCSRRSRSSRSPSYTVGRARKEFANQSSLGVMMTATNRNVGDERSPMRVLANSAYAGGVDWDWRLRKRYAMAGYVAGSTIHGTEAAIARLQENNVHSYQRPDATHVEFDPTRTSLSGQSGFLAFRKISGERVRFESNVGFKSPGFDSNDLGFIRRADRSRRATGSVAQRQAGQATSAASASTSISGAATTSTATA